MAMGSQVGVDRRALRRQATIDEILDVALELMAEHGVAALSLSEVARRVGMQPPSLYQYFDSRLAIYDALFERGGRLVREVQRTTAAGCAGADPLARARQVTIALCRWSIENQVYSQLLFWRTVPGFEPSPAAYKPAVESITELREHLQEAVEAGQLAAGAATEEGIALYTSMIAGPLSQQLANEPDAPYDEGRFTALVPTVLDMFAANYKPDRGTR
jgi:AcrR family transcriptional regulator